MINAKGHYDETKNRALIEMTICLVGQLLLVGKLGIIGVLIGTIIAHVYRMIDVVIYTNKEILKQNMSRPFIRIGYNLLILIAILIIGFRLIVKAERYVTWGIYACITIAITFSIILAINAIINRNTVKDGKEYIRNFVKKRNTKE